MTDTPGPPSRPADSGAPPTRQMDARSLRGLAHPLRMRILELLRLDGPDTATGLGGRLGENTGTVSWHVRHLAAHGFIEEETGRGTRRERWWRAARAGNNLNTTEFRDDPDTRGALSVYVHELVQQQFHRVVDYLTEDWDAEWRHAGTLTQWHDLRLGPAQLAALNAELAEVVDRHRAAAQRASGAGEPAGQPVLVQLQSFPRKERGER
ncbi:helix-turn-helix transcriptional regulator [Streptomyces sioyaensis]|uniref:winged helix-turn-helix domain-containing protein n=1 Tax=Streptomyces sioyaensis TaxID=67364 RepID=UPI001F425249|nr:helix-turn-helix domain-containing protein [Streptomyces sioyaensis]MCF3175736.1 helix-turn-helix transcriptional regulator [Streptomyces sioyaensis]